MFKQKVFFFLHLQQTFYTAIVGIHGDVAFNIQYVLRQCKGWIRVDIQAGNKFYNGLSKGHSLGSTL